MDMSTQIGNYRGQSKKPQLSLKVPVCSCPESPTSSLSKQDLSGRYMFLLVFFLAECRSNGPCSSIRCVCVYIYIYTYVHVPQAGSHTITSGFACIP